MIKSLAPERWANDITVILKASLGEERFPVDVGNVAREISTIKFPDDPISLIRGDSLPGFDGALAPAPSGKKGWGIIYNSDISSKGRINFTLAHEFGHYLLHRFDYPKGFQCASGDMTSWDSEYARLEAQANCFASTLLMPLDDFRRQVDPKDRPGIDALGYCAERYEVSLIATILRWLQYTTRRSMVVISRDDFILWSRSSEPAFRTGMYFKTCGQPPIEIPDFALAKQPSAILGGRGEVDHNSGTWFNTPCKEHVLVADQYDFIISLLHFDDAAPQYNDEPESEEDTYSLTVTQTFRQPRLD
ncbi:MAG: ImmA/IrrE family metallo-endopeptidase [Caldilineaceae bacterium]|nr:ImmA/IrrE family metallo-endopeptidase [Caldilineaceae bacterium]